MGILKSSGIGLSPHYPKILDQCTNCVKDHESLYSSPPKSWGLSPPDPLLVYTVHISLNCFNATLPFSK